ncbi:MAG: Ig-like domain-containing protein, partial [Thiohalomonadales bacterium]
MVNHFYFSQLIQSVHFSKAILITLLSSSVAACGGGSGGSTPPPPAKDVKPPYVISTIPRSESSEVLTSDYIKVQFNEPLATITTEQVTIYPVINNEIDRAGQIKLNNADSFVFNTKSNLLTVQLKIGDLKINSHYRVTLKNIKDTNDNALLTPCQWDFTTLTAPAITVGNTGVCGTEPPADPPGAIQQLTATALSETSVAISWRAPVTGSVADYYQIDRSTDNQKTFTTLINRHALLNYTDTTALKGVKHFYKITAGNDTAGLSKKILISNGVIPEVQPIVIKPKQVLVSTAPATGNYFGYNFSFSPDGNTLIVGEFSGDPAGATDTGLLHVFTKTTTGWMQQGNPLQSTAPATGNRFGANFTFSPDGNTLVVGEHLGDPVGAADTGLLHVFTKTTTGWMRQGSPLQSTAPAKGNMFGTDFTFSPDGNTLVVGEYMGDPAGAADAGLL